MFRWLSPQLLLEAGSNIDSVDQDGNTPLHVKCYGESGEVTDLECIEKMVSTVIPMILTATALPMISTAANRRGSPSNDDGSENVTIKMNSRCFKCVRLHVFQLVLNVKWR